MQEHSKMKINNQKNNKKKIIIASLLAATALLAGAYYTYSTYVNKETPAQNKTKESLKSKEDRTYETKTEGQTITVPDNVDESSIKNYTLVVEDETYKIRELDGQYYITLYAIINRPDQSDTYRDQLQQYKQDALDYLENKNIDTNKIKIYYDPSEAESL